MADTYYWKLIVHWVIMSVDILLYCLIAPLYQIWKGTRAIEFVDIVMTTRYAKKSMPYTQVIAYHSFKKSSLFFLITGTLHWPCCWALLLCPVHASQRSKHALVSSYVSFVQQSIYSFWRLLNCCHLPNFNLLVESLCGYTIC